MANVSGLRICPTCGADRSESGFERPCPRCGSDALFREERRRSFAIDLQDRGFSPLQPIAFQLRNRLKAIEAVPMGEEERYAQVREAQTLASRLVEEMPGEVKIDLLNDCFRMLSHKLLDDLPTAKQILGLGMAIGKLCENIDAYQKLRGGKY